MEIEELPGSSLSALHECPENIFVSEKMICFLESGSINQLRYYDRETKEEKKYAIKCPFSSTQRNYFGVPNCCTCHVSSGKLYLQHYNADKRTVAIIRLAYDLATRTIITQTSAECPFSAYILRCGDMIRDNNHFGEIAAVCLSNGKHFQIPKHNYVAAFTYTDSRSYLSSPSLFLIHRQADLQSSTFAIVYDLNNMKIARNQPITVEATVAIINVQKAHVINDVVFLLDELNKKLLKLDLKKFRITNVTSKVPLTEDHVRFAFHEKYLYAASSRLHQALHRFDLTTLIDSQEEETSAAQEVTEAPGATSVECPVCLEPFADPKVFTKCGHSICDQCEKQITVVNGSERKKTLTCPECRVATVIGLNETLPTNWALKSGSSAPISTKSPENTANSVHCEFCKEALAESKTFNCEFCAEKERKPEVFVCGTCVVKNHSDHINRVKSAEFADREYRNQKIGHISRDPTEPERELSTLSAEIRQKADVELNAFFGDLKRDYEKVSNQVTRLMAAAPMTKRAMDSEAEEIGKDETRINTKIQKLQDWKKEVYECFSKLNNAA